MLQNLPASKTRLIQALLIAGLNVLCLPVSAQQEALYKNPVIPGDFPDPSVIRVGKDYWAMTTTGAWAPHFPILHSRDLVNWRIVGHVFQQKPPWVKSDFWAPEIIHDRGRFLVYYTARRDDGARKVGTLCVAVATAPAPAGPYNDHGPLVCQIPELKNVGSIDAFFIRDEHNTPYLVWKADGNDAEPDQPTSIFAQRLSEDGTKLIGKRSEILRNTEAWEKHVTEGSFILRRNGWLYHFYSGNACCGRGCAYALGVARARKLLGPWEKNKNNPILGDNEDWQCPGHGSIVSTPDGRDFLLYHSYRRRRDTFSLGREALLDEVHWDADGWPMINSGRGPTSVAAAPLDFSRAESNAEFFDGFNAPQLGLDWQWPMFSEQKVRVEVADGGHLILEPPKGSLEDEWTGTVAARRFVSGNVVVTTLAEASGAFPQSRAGLSAYSWRDRSIGIAFGGNKVMLWSRAGKDVQTLATTDVPRARALYLRMTAQDAELYRFAYSANGRDWTELGEPLNGRNIEGAHIALTGSGAPGAVARFDWIRITPRADNK
ncbi:MAG TPA: family 43 glycosylhydrolase [Vicinamibacterales bacterium]|nr:family 43 glycosylhydrolase [Vicinamibacterales bacterium]